tara:strand:- start:915 stop:1868 length:954 start_codon:yes stop_codon:yes gene_type:complete
MIKILILIILSLFLIIISFKKRDFFEKKRDFFEFIAYNNDFLTKSESEGRIDFNEKKESQSVFKLLIDKSVLKIFKSKSVNDFKNLKKEPLLKFKSYDNCPNLYNLFHGLPLKDTANNLIRGKNNDGFKFHNELVKLFYNSSFFVREEHPIINIEAEDNTSQRQDFEFYIDADNVNILKYNQLERSNTGKNCHLEENIKNINFQVKNDFTLEDIYRFVDFCYTQLCYGMIYIEEMKLMKNGYRVFPSPYSMGSFFILPERIRYQVAKEGKYYTRAKCNTSCLNIIVLFGKKLPEKFSYIYKKDDVTETECEIPKLIT